VSDSREIVLAGKTYKITVPLTLDQLIAANVGMQIPTSTDPIEEAKLGYERAMNVIVAACAPEHPEITKEFLRGLRGMSLKEFNAASKAVYEESGLIARRGDSEPGEAEGA
jgi:hypothetical protein